MSLLHRDLSRTTNNQDRERTQPPQALCVGMDESSRNFWVDRLPSDSWRIREARSGTAALEILSVELSELVLVASRLPDLDVSEFEEIVRAEYPTVQVVRLDAGIGSLEPNEQIAKTEPDFGTLDHKTMLHVIPPAQDPITRVVDAPIRSWHELVGQSPLMQKVYRNAQIVARRDTTVLIQGESGTGKDVLARGIHAASKRERQPFVVINCAAIPEALLEAELFGYTKGAFTGAAQSRVGRIHAAHAGTLFLDEIGDMPYPLQSKILRFLEQGEVQRIGETETLKVDCRIIAATSVDLKQSVAAKQFREDLYYRLAIFPIAVPPLRHRLEDLDELISHFLQKFSPGYTLSPRARTKLHQHSWPGNVRELRNVLERASLFAEDRREIAIEDICF